MQSLFSYRFSENIWRILPDADPEHNLWAIELRNVDEKKVSFAVIDAEQKRVLWQREVEGADWWSSLTAFTHGKIYLHNYRFPEIPEPTDLLTISAGNGDLEWVLPNHILVRPIGPDLLEVANKQGDQFVKRLCEPATGKILQTSEYTFQEADEIILKEPFRYKEGNEYFERLKLFVQNKTGGHLAKSIDYLEKKPYVIFSYYIYEQDKTVQYLLIVSDQHQLILHEKLSDERDGMGRSTMILKASTLVYLKNNNEFSSLKLSQ